MAGTLLVCPNCRAAVPTARDVPAGTPVKCRSCAASFAAGGEASRDAQARNLILAALGGVALLLVGGVALVWALAGDSPDTPAPEVAEAPRPAEPPRPSPGPTPATAPAPAPPAKAEKPPDAAPVTKKPKEPEPKEPEPKEPKYLTLQTDQGQTVQVPAQGDPWADRVVSYTMGRPAPKKNRNAQNALGKPNFLRKAGEGRGSVALGHGGTVVLEFVDNVLVDGSGDDLVICEVGGKIEGTSVEISADGQTWVSVGKVVGAKSTIDIGPHVQQKGKQFRFVRLTDLKQGKSNKSDFAGADIDAVGTLQIPPADGATKQP